MRVRTHHWPAGLRRRGRPTLPQTPDRFFLTPADSSGYFANKSVKWSAPPVGGFEVRFFIRVRRLRFTFVSGTPLTVTL